MILVTGGAGFIGANFILDWMEQTGEPVLNLDALTYAGNRESLATLDGDTRHVFVHGDITDRTLLDRLFAQHQPRAVIHFYPPRCRRCWPICASCDRCPVPGCEADR